jgi:hypothetical protein
MDPQAPPPEPLHTDRDARIAELEARLTRRSGVGVKAPVALIAILAAGGLMWLQRLDVEYYFSSREPVTLGSEGDYRFESLTPNRYAQVHGIPTARGAYSSEKGTTYVVVGLRDTPVLVRRPALPGEDWKQGSTPPQPNQSPFGVRGRLLSCVVVEKPEGGIGCGSGEAARYEEGFHKLAELGEVRPRDGKLWILIQGDSPRSNLGTLAWMTGLVLFAAINGWLLWRDLAHRLRKKA